MSDHLVYVSANRHSRQYVFAMARCCPQLVGLQMLESFGKLCKSLQSIHLTKKKNASQSCFVRQTLRLRANMEEMMEEERY